MLNSILSFGKCFLDFILIFWFSTQFFNLRRKMHKAVPFAVILCFSVFLYLVNILCIPQINTGASLFSAIIINFLLFSGHNIPRLLCSIIEVLLVLICEFIPISIYSFIDSKNIAAVTNEIIKNAGFNVISTGLLSIIIIIVRYVTALKKQQDNKEISISENIALITVPTVSILIIYYILYMHTANTVTNGKLPLLTFFIFMGILIMNMAVIIGDNSLRRQHQLQRNLDRLNRLEQFNHLVIEQQNHYIEELKGFSHDYTKQMDGIKKLIDMKDGFVSNELQTYSEEMFAHIENSFRFAFIPSPALRAILSQAQINCNAYRITFEADIQYADFSFITFPDLYTLFENPLENAITACKALTADRIPRRIRLTIFRKRNMVWIEIKNPTMNPINIKNNLILTTKNNPSQHGFGLKNMKRVIHRYGGHMNLEYIPDEVSLTMAFPILQE